MNAKKGFEWYLISCIAIILGFVVFAPIGVLLLLLGIIFEIKDRKQKARIQQYCSFIIIGKMRSFHQISAKAGRSPEQVKKTVRKMISNGILYGAQIDEANSIIIMPSENSEETPFVSTVASGASISATPKVSLNASSVPHANVPTSRPRTSTLVSPPPVRQQNGEKFPFPWFSTICWAIFIFSILLIGLAIGDGTAIIITGIIAVLFAVGYVCGLIQAKNRMYCRSCKRTYDFDEDVSYRQIGHKVKSHRFNPKANSDHQLRSSEHFKLHVTCTCPLCGRSKNFKISVPGRRTYYDGSIKDFDPTLEIENYFKNRGFGSKMENLMIAGIGIVIILITAIVFAFNSSSFGAGSALSSDSANDPKNYYGTYYSSKNGSVYTLELKEDRTYSFTTTSVNNQAKKTQSGNLFYKSAQYMSDNSERFNDLEYSYEDALLLEVEEEDSYLIFWLIEKNGKVVLELNSLDITFNKKTITTDSSSEESGYDPKDYYGTYYSIENYCLQMLELTANNFTWKVTDFYTESVKTGKYQFIPADGDYYKKDALVLTDSAGNRYVLWLNSHYGNNYEVKFDGATNSMTSEEKSLDIYLDDGKDYSGTYMYHSMQNRFTLSKYDNTVSGFYLDGTLQKNFKYSFASSEYLWNHLKKYCDDSIILYNEQGQYYTFEITSNGLVLYDGNDALFEKID